MNNNVILTKEQHAPLLKVLEAVTFDGSHELPQEFWTYGSYTAICELKKTLEEYAHTRTKKGRK